LSAEKKTFDLEFVVTTGFWEAEVQLKGKIFPPK
jgi:hypothetical protein